MKFFTNELVALNDDGDYEAGIIYKATWEEYLDKHLPYIQSHSFSANFQNLYKYHFHDCQLLKLTWQDYNKNILMCFDCGLRELIDNSNGSNFNHKEVTGLKFINANIIKSDIEIPFSRFMRKIPKYKYIYFHHAEVDIDLENEKCIYRYLLSTCINTTSIYRQPLNSKLINLDIEFDSVEIIY